MQINKHQYEQCATHTSEGLGCKEIWAGWWCGKDLWEVVKQGRKTKVINSWLLLCCVKACLCMFALIYVLSASTKLELPGSKAEVVPISCIFKLKPPVQPPAPCPLPPCSEVWWYMWHTGSHWPEPPGGLEPEVRRKDGFSSLWRSETLTIILS